MCTGYINPARERRRVQGESAISLPARSPWYVEWMAGVLLAHNKKLQY